MQNCTQDFRIALIATAYTRWSHADVIASRWMRPLASDAEYGWVSPKTRIASMFVAQRPEGADLTGEKAKDFGIPVFRTVAEALTLGGNTLAVDAVLLIGEHGDYPVNEFRQRLYPRKELFDEVVEVFRKSGRVVPMFFDKHLSWKPEFITEMTKTVHDLKMPFFGGSSVPFSRIVPEVKLERTKVKEIVAVYYDALEAYLFHSVELVQAVVENRLGGECGVERIVAWEDAGVWDALARGEFSVELLEAGAAAVSPFAVKALRHLLAERGNQVAAFQLHYRDGMMVTHFMQKDVIQKWFLAGELESGTIKSGVLQTVDEKHFFAHFARLNCEIEKFFLTRIPPRTIDQLSFTSMATALSMRALHQSGEPLATPELSAGVPG